jgi:membrane protein
MRACAERLWALVRLLAWRFWDDRILQIAASLTFTTLLSLVPVATVVLSLLSAVPAIQGMTAVLEEWVFDNLVPDVADALDAYAQQFIDNAAHLTAVGRVCLAVTALMLLMTVENAFNDIWRVRRQRPWPHRVLIYWALITVGPLFMGASLMLSSWLLGASAGWTAAIPHAKAVLIKVFAVALTALPLALLYHLMPGRPIRPRDALIGGMMAGVLFEAAKHGFGFYITQFPTYKLVYGAFAAVPVFLLWVYVSWLVVLAGALLVAALPEWRQGSAHGRHAPGASFVHALQVLKVLGDAQRRGAAATLRELHERVRVRYERIETLLEVMGREGWVGRASSSGWALRRGLAVIPVADVFRLFVFNPAGVEAASEPALARLARAYGERVRGNSTLSVAGLFEAEEGAGEAPATTANAAPARVAD